MSTRQQTFLPFLACSIFLLTGALGRQAAPMPPAAPLHFVAVPVESSPVADAIRSGADFLDAAIKHYHPSRMPWLGMTIWQQWEDGESTYQVTGRLEQAPDQRVRLDLEVTAGCAEGKICVVSDGERLWQVRRVAADRPETRTVELPATSDQKAASASARILEEHGCAGFLPLLKTLHSRLQEPQTFAGLWKGRAVVVVRGTILPDEKVLGEVPAELRSALQPRQASVYLDAETLWPYRVEWWGSAQPGHALTLLLQIEFRDPVIGRPLSPEVCAQLFTTGQ